MTVILTACTQRKRVSHSPLLCARDLPKGKLSDVVEAWADRLSQVKITRPAKDLYCGRSFFEAVKAARNVQAELYIVSAGLGLVSGDVEVPSYNLTVSKGTADCVMNKLDGEYSEADWWAALGGSEALLQVIKHAGPVIVIGLPSPYLRMIAPTLALLSDELCSKLRIVGGRDMPDLDPRLEHFRLPYDDRLDGPDSSLPGTKSDFASRATRHFAEEILVNAPAASIEIHRALAEALMSTWTRPTTKSGIRMSDAALRSIIREHWSRAGGRSTKVLRILRDELNVACEQKRFANLAAEIRKEQAL
ncbi:hypothetical protein G6M04_00345 [Agrobacterium rhizogenes]|uniref:DUF6884 domain-containing protein n=1 Tax=Rhizobium rhizogenes TaxID=359 RepID=UPI001572203B|nr:DUF6884 domain-containing protein [Rhizobium rhizogenes]NTG45803.1 hypothetical protein [Rhizobium rhizogenes]